MSGGTKQRSQTSTDQEKRGLNVLRNHLRFRLNEKGHGIFVSSHEVLGVIVEEMGELTRAVETKTIPPNERRQNIRQELIDVAVAALFGIISIDTGEMDWI